MSEAGQLGSLDEENNLIINSKKVFMCLFINDISAEDLLNDSYWKTRCLLEGSNALKCPDVGSQIACLPSFQYELQRKDYVKSIIKDEELSDEMLRFFPRTYYMKDFSLNRDSLIALRQEKSNKELEVKKSEELKDLKETLFKKEQNKEENEQNQEIKIEDFQIPSESLEELEAKYNALKQDALAAIESEVNEILDRTANDKTKAISDISKETFKAYSIDHGKTLDDAFVDVTACEGFFKRKIEEPVFSNLALIDKGIVKGDFVNSINVFSLVVSNENRVITNRNLCVGSKSTCLKDGRSVYDTACLVDLKDETEISYDTY